MKMQESVFIIRVVCRSPVAITRETFEKVLAHSTTLEALDDALWASIDITGHDEAIDAGEELLEIRTEVYS